MRVAILGPLTVTDDQGQPVDLSGPRLRILLIRLALAGGRPVDSGALIDAVWGGTPPAAATNALQTLVSRLRRVLPAPAELIAEPTGYRLAGTRLDTEEFERLSGAGRAALRAGDPAGAAGALRAALELCRGPALIDAEDAEFARAAAVRLTELRLAATEDRIAAELALTGDGVGLIGELTELTAGYPLRERPHELLMRALAGSGRGAEAAAVYARLRATLADELGADPSPELAELNRDVLLGRAARPPGNLPAPLTSFVGRDAELARLDALLAGHRLVTLVGPGGAGKTRLATEVARAWGERLPGGAWLVELAPLRQPSDLPRALVEALQPRESTHLGLAGGGDGEQRLIEALSGPELLLVLDNCEHLVSACAALAGRLLAACPRVRILATSREPLAITGEALCPVGPLAAPPGPMPAAEALAFPAMRLFADRAAAARPGFALDERSAGHATEICRRLDGLPLAIELAAARLRSVPVDQIAARLGDRFRLLTGGSRTAMPRHQTLLAVVEWSWDLLDEAERTLARRMSVFLDGAVLEAVERVCDGDLVTLGGLVDKSFVTLSDEDGRYRMLETLRDFAAQKLTAAGETGTVRDAHARYLLELAEFAEPRLRTGEQLAWLKRLTAERDNLSGALRWAIDTGDADTAVRLGAALGWYWTVRGSHTEAVEWLEQATDLPGDVPADARGLALIHLAMNRMAVGDPEGSRRAYERATGEGPSDHPLIHVGTVLSALLGEDYARMAVALPAILDHPDEWTRGMGLAVRGWANQYRGDPDAFERDLIAAEKIIASVGDQWAHTVVTTSLADARSMRGDHDGAIEAHASAFALTEQMPMNTEERAMMLFQLISERLRAGDLPGARADLARAERLLSGSTALAPLAMLGLVRANVAAGGGELVRARALYETWLDPLRTLIGMQPEAPLFALTGLVWVTAALGDAAAAERYQREIAEVLRDSTNQPLLARATETLAAVLSARGDPAGAARALGSAEAVRGRPDLGSPEVAGVAAAARAALGPDRYAAEYAAGVAAPVGICPDPVPGGVPSDPVPANGSRPAGDPRPPTAIPRADRELTAGRREPTGGVAQDLRR